MISVDLDNATLIDCVIDHVVELVLRSEYLKPIEWTEVRSHLGYEISGVIPLATSASLETSISRAQEVAASFVEIGNKLAADKIVGATF